MYNLAVAKVYLSVIVPSYNEMANLQKGVLDKVKAFLDKSGKSYEVVVVDDGSIDGSVEFIKDFTKEHKEFRMIENPHMGKAGAVTTGMLKAVGKYVLFTDMDQATPIEEIDKLLPYFNEDYDVVIGSRSTTRKGAPLSRRLISYGNIILRKALVGLNGISDTQCGFKAFTNKSAKDLFGRIYEIHSGFQKITVSAVTSGFDVELLYIAQKKGYKIKEVPVRWLYVETRRVSPVHDSIEGVLDLIRIRKNAMKGSYNTS